MAVTTEIVTITPEMAEELLGRNVHNRNVRVHTVERYARDMAAGHWPLNGDPIRLNARGELLDGQHRLLACQLSGASFQTVLIRGLPDAVMPTIDMGTKRRLSDVLKLRGELDATNLAAAINLGERFDRGGGEELRQPGLPSVQEALAWLEANPSIREELRAVAPMRLAPLNLQPRIAAIFAYNVRRLNGDDLPLFLHKLETGIELRQRDPIYAFRRWLNRQHDMSARLEPYLLLGMLIKAWNYWSRQVEIEVLTFRQGEKFPEISGGETAQARRARRQRRQAEADG